MARARGGPARFRRPARRGIVDQYRAALNAATLFHSGSSVGITTFSGTGPHPQMGGHGTGPSDRGVRFYDDWLRDHVGPWQFPDHAKPDGASQATR